MFACKAGSAGSTSSASQGSMKAPLSLCVHLHRPPLAWRPDRLPAGSRPWLSPSPGAHFSVLTALAFRKGFYIQVI